ncbi:MAG: hypothetical protein KF721_15090 [Ignavibacteriaceae bacterium]|nr:hypothetical protein [Ignavibacteriaceae bacterium]
MTELNDEILFPVDYSAREIRCIVEELNPDIYIEAIEIYRSDTRLYIYLTINNKEICISEFLQNDNLECDIKHFLNKYSYVF